MRLLLLVLVVCVQIAPSALALTPPVAGAAAKPPGLTLASPFPCNVAYRIVGGYGGNMHTNIDEALKANDYHALDMVRDEAGNGHDKPVVAAASGTVRYAGWSKDGWKTYGNIVFIELDFKDGSSYFVHYAHLEKVLVQDGQHVNARDIVGHMGRSGDHSLTYWSASHLHFVFYRNAKLGSGGPYGGVAAVPEPLDGVEDFVTGKTATVTCPPRPPDAGPSPDASHDAADDFRGPPNGSGGTSDGNPTQDLGGLPAPAGDIGTDPPGTGSGCGCQVGNPAQQGIFLVLLSLLVLIRNRKR